jgi:hypothetical protein
MQMYTTIIQSEFSVEGRNERTGLLHFTVQCGPLHLFSVSFS